jgi:hypothetical protein
MTIRAATICALLFAAAAHAAPTDQQFADCRAIVDDAKRLACYDALSAPPTPDKDFGSASVPRPQVQEPDLIEAHLAGRIAGWRKGTQFALDNGQAWQSIDDDASDEVLDRTAVTIKRNFVGHYWMSVSRWQTVQVMRVK